MVGNHEKKPIKGGCMFTPPKYTGLAFGLLICLVGSLGYAQEWIARYDGPSNVNDYALALAVDDSGNVHSTGRSYGTGTWFDYATIKYDSAGDTVWIRRYNGPGNIDDCAQAIAVDGSGYVYVTGYSYGSGTSSDYVTIKYNSAGDTTWIRRYNGPGNFYDEANSLVLDGMGNIYVTGYSFGSGTSNDYATIKYNPSGDTVWVRRYNGPGNDLDVASAMAVDDSGYVYVTGSSVGLGTGDDYATIKYNPSGDTVWVRRYNGLSNDLDVASAIKVDIMGSVYVTGRSYGSGTYEDYMTIKYDSAGNALWDRRYNGPGNGGDGPSALALDNSGYVYVTGGSYGSGTYEDYATIKYNSAGSAVWIRRYNGPGNGEDGASAIALDNRGYVYVTGGSNGSGTYFDYATIKYNSLGMVEEKDGFVVNPGNVRLAVYPNPGVEKVNIRYTIHDSRYTTLNIYDATGRLVKSFNHLNNSQYNEIMWSGDDNLGSGVRAGIYFVRIKAGDYNAVEKVVLLR